jgi:hypothetical protein
MCVCVPWRIVNTTQLAKLPLAKIELHRLLENHDLHGLPMLVLANKVDCAKIERIELVKSLNLDYITDNPWTVLAVSAKHGDGTS